MSAPHFVLLRGLGREARHWGDFPELLKAAIPGAHVTCLDLPGAGCYSETKCPLSIPEITDFVRGRMELIEAKDGEALPERHLVAISLGGMVATDWLERFPGDFASCVMINTSFRGYSPIYHRLQLPALRHLASAAVARTARAREYEVLRMVSNRREILGQTSREWAKIHLTRPVSSVNFLRQLFAATMYRPSLEVPPVPVLVLASRKDRMVSPSCSQDIAARWKAEIAWHPEAGHDLPLDDSQWVAERIRDFYRKLQSEGVDTLSRA